MKTIKFFEILLFAMIILGAFYSAALADDLTITITSPEHRANFENCSDILVHAEASVQNGEISKVEFYRNGDRVGTDTREPYEITNWKSVPNGLYELSAKAFDAEGNEALSNTVLINVGNTDDGNLLINGDFNCKMDPWRFDNYEGAVATFELWPGATLTEDSSAGYIEIQEIGNYFWGVQLMQPFKLQSGHTYEVSFTAETFAAKPIQITFSQDYDPYEPHWYQDIEISGYGTYGPYTYECDVDDPQVMFKFVVGGNLEPIFLDGVKVIDKQWTNISGEYPKTVQQFHLYQNFPNPFNPETTIKYSLTKPENIKLTIYNLLGDHIISFTDHKSPGSHEIKWRGQDKQGNPVDSGIYIYKLETENYSLYRKMLLLK